MPKDEKKRRENNDEQMTVPCNGWLKPTCIGGRLAFRMSFLMSINMPLCHVLFYPLSLSVSVYFFAREGMKGGNKER